jgi:hypothetical protein
MLAIKSFHNVVGPKLTIVIPIVWWIKKINKNNVFISFQNSCKCCLTPCQNIVNYTIFNNFEVNVSSRIFTPKCSCSSKVDIKVVWNFWNLPCILEKGQIWRFFNPNFEDMGFVRHYCYLFVVTCGNPYVRWKYWKSSMVWSLFKTHRPWVQTSNLDQWGIASLVVFSITRLDLGWLAHRLSINSICYIFSQKKKKKICSCSAFVILEDNCGGKTLPCFEHYQMGPFHC